MLKNTKEEILGIIFSLCFQATGVYLLHPADLADAELPNSVA